ncbi:MAG: type VI secretion system tube protein Hcp [Lysobacteraceae bacterium]|nr:MAG: type VI secretion system tube protein Hcp [Xanthomonadaceae bacterium]
MSSVDAFLKIDGVKGESTDAKHKDEIEIMSMNWSAHSSGNMGSGGGGGVGKAIFSDFSFTKKVDIASPKLALIAARGEHIKSAKISIRKAGGAAGQVDYQVYDLDKLYVTGLQVSGGEGGEFFETLTLSPTKFKWEYKQQGDDGSLKGNMAVTVDRAANTAS